MPLILKNLLNSEKFIYVLLLWQIPMLVLVWQGRVSVDEWRQDALWALGILIGGKTVQGTAAVIANGKSDHKKAKPAPVEPAAPKDPA